VSSIRVRSIRSSLASRAAANRRIEPRPLLKRGDLRIITKTPRTQPRRFISRVVTQPWSPGWMWSPVHHGHRHAAAKQPPPGRECARQGPRSHLPAKPGGQDLQATVDQAHGAVHHGANINEDPRTRAVIGQETPAFHPENLPHISRKILLVFIFICRVQSRHRESAAARGQLPGVTKGPRSF
jgi:hypothetical protein